MTAENITPEIPIEVKSGEEISPQFSTPNLSDLATSDHAPRWEWRIVVETVNGADNFLLTSVFHDGEKIAKMQTPSEISQWNLDDLRAEMHEMAASFSKPFIRRTFPGLYTEEPRSWVSAKDGVEAVQDGVAFREDLTAAEFLQCLPLPSPVDADRFEALAEFARIMIRYSWEGDADGGDIQEKAHELGLTVKETATAADCVEGNFPGDPGDPIYRFAPWLREFGQHPLRQEPPSESAGVGHTILQSPQKARTCACVEDDAYDCWAQRYLRYGRSPSDVIADGGPCDCSCHQGNEDDA